MPESYLALLNTGAQVSQDAFGRIDNAMKTAFLQQEQSRQFDQQMANRASEFQAEMAYKDRALAADTQKNLLLADNMRFNNEMQWREYQARAELAPLAREASILQLETAKLNHSRAIQAGRDQQFAQILGPHRIQAAGVLSMNQNEQFGNDYLSLEAEAKAEMLKTGKFDEATFSQRLDNLIAGYGKTPSPDAKYNPGVAVLMDNMGAPNEAARYRARNPSFEGAATSIISNMIMGTDAAYNDSIRSIGNTFSKDEQANIALSRRAYQTIDMEIAGYQNDKRNLNYAAARQDPNRTKELDAEKDQLDNKISEARKKQTAILNTALGATISFQEPKSEEDMARAEREAKRKQAEEQIAEAKKKGEGAYGAPLPVSAFSPNAELNDKQSQIGNFLYQFPEAFGTPENPKINFNSWKGQNPRAMGQKAATDFTTSLRSRVIDNISNIPLDAQELREEGISDSNAVTLDSLITSPKFEAALNQLAGRPISVDNMNPNDKRNNSGLTGSLDNLSGYSSTRVGATSASGWINNINSWMRRNLGDQNDWGEIGSVDDVKRLLKTVDNREQRRKLAELIYSSVVSAAAVDSFSK